MQYQIGAAGKISFIAQDEEDGELLAVFTRWMERHNLTDCKFTHVEVFASSPIADENNEELIQASHFSSDPNSVVQAVTGCIQSDHPFGEQNAPRAHGL